MVCGEGTNATMSLLGIWRHEWGEQVSGKRKVITSVVLRKRGWNEEKGSGNELKSSEKLDVPVSSAIVIQQCAFG